MISGPSGVGKSSIVNAVLDRTNSQFSTSATTRAPRPSEIDGREYHFLRRDEFESRIQSGDVLEWAEYGGNLYGTLRSEVLPVLAGGANVVLDIENEGGKQIRASFPEAVLIFIRPPSLEELERRLRSRGDTSDADIDRRLAVAAHQIAEAPAIYDHIVLNDDLDTAIGPEGQRGPDLLLAGFVTHRDGDDFRGRARFLEAHGLFHGYFTERIDRHLHVIEIDVRPVRLCAHLDVVVHDALNSYKNLHGFSRSKSEELSGRRSLARTRLRRAIMTTQPGTVKSRI